MSSSYPYCDPDPVRLKKYTDSIYKADQLSDVIREHQSFYLEWPFEIICFSLKYLEETFQLHLDELVFCDCMGLGMQVALIASTFTFKELVTIELSEEDVNLTQEALNNSTIMVPPIFVRIGRFQDYFIVNADIVYLDCNLLGPFLDEGLLLESFFTCCQNLQIHSYLFLITRSDCYDLEAKGFEILLYQYSKKYSHYYLCRKRSPMK